MKITFVAHSKQTVVKPLLLSKTQFRKKRKNRKEKKENKTKSKTRITPKRNRNYQRKWRYKEK